MNKAIVKKLIIEAYISGAESVYCGCYERPTKTEARDWYNQQYGVEEIEDCECCNNVDDDGDS
jgi:hypothetical protein